MSQPEAWEILGIRQLAATDERAERLHHVDPARAQARLVDGRSLRAVARARGAHATTVRRALARRITRGAAGLSWKAASERGA